MRRINGDFVSQLLQTYGSIYDQSFSPTNPEIGVEEHDATSLSADRALPFRRHCW
jgi:hypothetical protein